MEFSLLPSHLNWKFPAVMNHTAILSGRYLMTRSLSPFTRLTLLISEIKENKIEDLTDVKRCDLEHHTAKLSEEFDDLNQKETAGLIEEQGKLMLSLIREGELVKAEERRQSLLSTCKGLKDLL
jgi:hypothetical protein